MATYTSETIPFEVGNTTITISGIGSTNLTMYILDVGEIEWRHEVPNNNEQSPTAIATQQGKCTIKVFDTLSDGSSLYEDLLASYSTINDLLECTISVSGLGDIDFSIRYDGFKISERDKIITITLTPYIQFIDDPDVTPTLGGVYVSVGSLAALYAPATYLADDGTNFDIGLASFKDLVVAYLSSAGGAYPSSTNYFSSPPRLKLSGSGTYIFEGTSDGFLTDEVVGAGIELGATPSSKPFLTLLSRIAAISGCFFGGAFGKSYFIYRLDKGSIGASTQVSIDWDNVLDFAVDRKLNTINLFISTINASKYYAGTLITRSGSTTWNNTGVFTTGGTTDPIVLSNFSRQVYNISFDQAAICYKYNTTKPGGFTTTAPAFYRNDTTSETYMFDDMINAGIKAYCKALSAEGADKITMYVRGVGSILPHQTFRIANAPALYDKYTETGANSYIYRPSVIRYNLKLDKVYVEAYQIGDQA